ncbi:glycerol-3-phosphate responsive antiterminator [Lucifera butyrica]|uniref:Glycerol-3-phosphate responsive antiterminator n=1 Tax=Lucifera butyrica TaxID=1351585 RepID=A0A498R239_9FIRM|nr:glycerol-3-phosphate responsive antiterminator [Lucifera butyrica]VBB05451.1 glycerol-3-phosphate responsive antiterminator [Lucifera butyrica]
MTHQSFLKLLCNGPVIPAPRMIEDFKFALTQTAAPSIILLFSDVNTLPGLLAQAQQHKKRLVVHLDLLDGAGKDRAGIKLLARMGVTALITTKPHLGKFAREEGMIVIQRLFLVDSEALKTGIHLVNSYKPDALEALPASIPASTVEQLARETNLPILAGGLLHTREDVANALRNGISAVSTSHRELWDFSDM